MHSDPLQPSFLADMRRTIFAKTGKGRNEIAQRSASLSAKQRTVLIMLNGNKPLDDVDTMLPEQDVANIVLFLLEQNFITAQEGATCRPDAAIVPGLPLSVITPPARSAGLTTDPVKLREIKDFMNATARTYLGLLAMELVHRVEHAADAAQLISVLGQWHMALRESKNGKLLATDYVEQIKASFRGEPLPATPHRHA